MKNIHCLNNISQVGLNALSSDYQLVDSIDQAHAIMVRSANMHDMELPKSVLAIARAGAGVNNIPFEELASKGVVVFNTPGANANAVKELIITGMLISSRDIYGGIKWVKDNHEDPLINKTVEKAKSQFGGTEISGKTIGIIGVGAIGIKLAHACNALGMKVVAVERDAETMNHIKAFLPSETHCVNTREELFPLCDFISLNLPFTPQTKHIIDQDAMKLMKQGVVLLNFARDGLVNDDHLEIALKNNHIKKYVTDFPNSKTANMEGVIAIPHLGASTEEAEDNCAYMASMQIQDYIENGNIVNSVNFPGIKAGVCTMASRIEVLYEDKSNVYDLIEKIAQCAHEHTEYTHQEAKGYGVAILDCDEKMDQVTIDAIDNLAGVIKVRVLK
ncbi:MAG: 3-phosphoglycerate dehydrogenase [Tenericutes bacterium HGW-Tenericutes-3]|nr:MAG: 3-phosphoglycerate dehydrogenase [Tenericutes bacterium HGW-Tenericutes-3]